VVVEHRPEPRILAHGMREAFDAARGDIPLLF
jgi:hypothetical protein